MAVRIELRKVPLMVMAVRIELWKVPLMVISNLIHISIRLVPGCARAQRFGSLHALTADQFVFFIDVQCDSCISSRCISLAVFLSDVGMLFR